MVFSGCWAVWGLMLGLIVVVGDFGGLHGFVWVLWFDVIVVVEVLFYCSVMMIWCLLTVWL